MRAIVGERFRELRDYTDPERLFGSHEALAKSAEEAGDFSDPVDTAIIATVRVYIEDTVNLPSRQTKPALLARIKKSLMGKRDLGQASGPDYT